MKSLSWVMRVYPPPGPRGGDPIRPAEGGGGREAGKFACDGFPKWRGLEGGHAACAAASQRCEGKGVVGGGGGVVGGGHLLAWP